MVQKLIYTEIVVFSAEESKASSMKQMREAHNQIQELQEDFEVERESRNRAEKQKRNISGVTISFLFTGISGCASDVPNSVHSFTCFNFFSNLYMLF